MPDIKIGTRCWVVDGNRRKYDKDNNLIYRYQWVEKVVVGETSMSWIVGYGPGLAHGDVKFSKKDAREQRRMGVVWSERELKERLWDNKHRYKVIDQLGRCGTATILEVAKMIGYKELP